MNKQNAIRICLFAAIFAFIGMIAPVRASTVAYWRFEEGPAEAQVSHGGLANGVYYEGTADSSGNGYGLSVWAEGWAGYRYKTDVASAAVSGNANNFSVKNDGGYPAMFTATADAINTIEPAAFTIEATFKLENGGNKTIVGRDSRGSNTQPGGNLDLAALYFQTVPNNGLAIKFCDVSGYWHEAIAATGSYVGFDWSTNPDGLNTPWYSMAAVSDGSVLSLYLRNLTAGGDWVLIARTDMTLSGSPDTALTRGTGDGGDWNAGDWSVGRGLYAGGHVDRAFGFIDEVRISDAALAPGSFLYPARFVVDSPANGASLIPVVLTAAENDLVFTVYDENIAEVDVLLDTENDPNLTANPAYKIEDGMSVTPGQYTVNLESLPANLEYETTYYWKVIGYEPNAVSGQNDIAVPGAVFSFTTLPADASVTLDDPFVAVDAGTPAVLSVTAIAVDSYQWYKAGTPDAALTDGSDYSGVHTDTLTILDMQQADEGYYYCVGTNVLGSDTSASGRVMIWRQTSYYNFESISAVDSNNVFLDSLDGYHAVLKQDSASAGWPTVGDANQFDVSMGNYLVLDNADHTADPNGQYLQIYPGVVDYEDITMSMWVHPKSISVWSRIFDFGNGTTDFIFLTADNGGGNMRFAAKIDNGNEQLLNDTWLSSGSWYFVAVTIDGNTGRLYRNGELVATNTGMSINPIDVGAVLNYIGKSQYPADPEFNGMIDELKIYNYARTSEQIAKDYVNLAGGLVCNYEGTADLTYDFDGDCQVGLSDFAEIAADWLNSNLVYPD